MFSVCVYDLILGPPQNHKSLTRGAFIARKFMCTGPFVPNLHLAAAVKIFWISASGTKCKREIIWSFSAMV